VRTYRAGMLTGLRGCTRQLGWQVRREGTDGKVTIRADTYRRRPARRSAVLAPGSARCLQAPGGSWRRPCLWTWQKSRERCSSPTTPKRQPGIQVGRQAVSLWIQTQTAQPPPRMHSRVDPRNESSDRGIGCILTPTNVAAREPECAHNRAAHTPHYTARTLISPHMTPTTAPRTRRGSELPLTTTCHSSASRTWGGTRVASHATRKIVIGRE